MGIEAALDLTHQRQGIGTAIPHIEHVAERGRELKQNGRSAGVTKASTDVADDANYGVGGGARIVESNDGETGCLRDDGSIDAFGDGQLFDRVGSRAKFGGQHGSFRDRCAGSREEMLTRSPCGFIPLCQRVPAENCAQLRCVIVKAFGPRAKAHIEHALPHSGAKLNRRGRELRMQQIGERLGQLGGVLC